ncbi:MAG: hypothetical protein HY319_24730 [Armatimonadetes bacterium]|nr:hypothetical protein [Armatimonadota bacterium]
MQVGEEPGEIHAHCARVVEAVARGEHDRHVLERTGRNADQRVGDYGNEVSLVLELGWPSQAGIVVGPQGHVHHHAIAGQRSPDGWAQVDRVALRAALHRRQRFPLPEPNLFLKSLEPPFHLEWNLQSSIRTYSNTPKFWLSSIGPPLSTNT